MSVLPEKPIGTITRAAEIGQILVKHGAKNLAAALGFTPSSNAIIDPREFRPAAVVAFLRDIGPVGIKLGQLLATRSDLFAKHWIADTVAGDRPLPAGRVLTNLRPQSRLGDGSGRRITRLRTDRRIS